MISVQLAVIILSPPEDGCGLILDKDLAGLSPLKRLLLTLQGAGVKEILIIHKDLDELKLNSLKNEYASDSRVRCKLHWQNKKDFSKHYSSELTGSQPFLLTHGNIVTTEKVIENFVKTATNDSTCTKSVLTLLRAPEQASRICLIPPDNFNLLEQYIQKGVIESDVKGMFLSDPDFLVWEINTCSDLRDAENWILKQYRKHHSQFMDKWFNSIFSIQLSKIFVKTPVTPNQLTVFGLVFGLVSGWFFARGSYWNGVCGGIFLAITAVWDCCDGDVARLKYMQSDFGDTLDTWCDNLINLFAFTGIMLGVSRDQGIHQALIPFFILLLGAALILVLIYYPKGGKGVFFKGTKAFAVIEVLASRNFIYIILLFAVMGRLDFFLWLAGYGSMAFALWLYIVKQKIKRAGLTFKS